MNWNLLKWIGTFVYEWEPSYMNWNLRIWIGSSLILEYVRWHQEMRLRVKNSILRYCPIFPISRLMNLMETSSDFRNVFNILKQRYESFMFCKSLKSLMEWRKWGYQFLGIISSAWCAPDKANFTNRQLCRSIL